MAMACPRRVFPAPYPRRARSTLLPHTHKPHLRHAPPRPRPNFRVELRWPLHVELDGSNDEIHGYMAQWLERMAADQQAPGSNPGVPFHHAWRRLERAACTALLVMIAAGPWPSTVGVGRAGARA